MPVRPGMLAHPPLEATDGTTSGPVVERGAVGCARTPVAGLAVESPGRPAMGQCPALVFEGILWVLRTGARWKDLPDRYPSPATCWRRLRDWEEAGVWLALWRAFLSTLDTRGRLAWEETFADGSLAPAKKGAPAVGKTKRGKGTQ